MSEVNSADLVVRAPREERLLLGAAAAQWCADSIGVRVLHIKGFTVQEFVPGRAYCDVDVWVDPSREVDYLACLEQAGFELGYSRVQRGFESHATDVLAQAFGVKIDVHVEFPGIDVPAQEAFESLWRERRSQTVAGHQLACPGRVDNALIIALHAARTPAGSGHVREATTTWHALTQSEQADLAARAHALRAESVLGLSVPTFAAALDPRDVEYFETIRSGKSRTQVWVARIRHERSWRRKMELAVGILEPPVHHGESHPRNRLARFVWTVRQVARDLGIPRRRR